VNSIKPELLVVTGDLTNGGYEHEYEEAKAYLDRIETKNKMVVPGNHDARNEGYMIFEDIFKTRYPCYENERVMILGIDSSEPDIDDGHIGRETCAEIKEKLTSNSKIKILAMHHHLIPIPGTGRERNIPVDAGDVLKLCVDNQVNFVFSGHKHKPWIWKLENTYLVTAGTATSRRLKGRSYPSYNLFEIDGRKAILKEVNVVNKNLEEILNITIS
jgi:3',5'-cyclic AMP phosphodiesterase CpdA